MKIYCKKVSKLTLRQQNEIISFLINCFKDVEGFDQLVYSNKDMDLCILVRNKSKKIIAHVSIVKKITYLNNKKYQIGGVGNVAVAENFRHEGLGLKIMKKVNTTLADKKYDLGMLFCSPDLENFYLKLGWIKKISGKIIVQNNEIANTDNDLTFIYPITTSNEEINKWLKNNVHIGNERW